MKIFKKGGYQEGGGDKSRRGDDFHFQVPWWQKSEEIFLKIFIFFKMAAIFRPNLVILGVILSYLGGHFEHKLE